MLRNLHYRFVSDPLAFLLILLFIGACASPKPSYSSKTRRAKTNKVTQVRSEICRTAISLEGSNYRYGGKEPKKGFDCSGFTSYVMRKNGVKLSGPSYDQANRGTKKELSKVRPGDLVFFSNKGKINHVGIVIENQKNKLLVAHSTSSRGVVIDNVLESSYWAKRLEYGRNVVD
jgi:cell wall-associated NlpC family hydrolase